MGGESLPLYLLIKMESEKNKMQDTPYTWEEVYKDWNNDWLYDIAKANSQQNCDNELSLKLQMISNLISQKMREK